MLAAGSPRVAGRVPLSRDRFGPPVFSFLLGGARISEKSCGLTGAPHRKTCRLRRQQPARTGAQAVRSGRPDSLLSDGALPLLNVAALAPWPLSRCSSVHDTTPLLPIPRALRICGLSQADGLKSPRLFAYATSRPFSARPFQPRRVSWRRRQRRTRRPLRLRPPHMRGPCPRWRRPRCGLRGRVRCSLRAQPPRQQVGMADCCALRSPNRPPDIFRSDARHLVGASERKMFLSHSQPLRHNVVIAFRLCAWTMFFTNPVCVTQLSFF